jgi:hypothetical protein
VNFDAEVSADGQTLYAVDSRFSAGGTPLTADLFIARKMAREPAARSRAQRIAAICCVS